MTGNTEKSRVLANLKEKKRSIFDSYFDNLLFEMLFYGFRKVNGVKVLENIDFVRLLASRTPLS